MCVGVGLGVGGGGVNGVVSERVSRGKHMISGRVVEHVGVALWKGGVPKECGWFVARPHVVGCGAV